MRSFLCWLASSATARLASSILADRVGRDHTTVSRQVTKLESLGSIERKPSRGDRRINEANITPAGRTLTRALDAARLRLAAPILTKWTDEDFSDLVRLLRRFVDDLMALPERTDRAKEDPALNNGVARDARIVPGG